MSKVGGHVVSGSKNGYEEFCTAKPAVMLAVDEGGDLKLAWDKGNCYPITIFRDTTLYLEAPQGIDQMTPEQAIQTADQLYPQLKAKWDLNPADYYTVFNEPFDKADQNYPAYLAYEVRMMELAEKDYLKLCVLNFATGSPGDLQFWKDVCVPHIKRAFQGGHIYGRHAYSIEVEDIVPLTGNTGRPFVRS